jgi:hypothetical protein
VSPDGAASVSEGSALSQPRQPAIHVAREDVSRPSRRLTLRAHLRFEPTIRGAGSGNGTDLDDRLMVMGTKSQGLFEAVVETNENV